MFFALMYYALSGRKWFKGPRVNVAHMIHGVGGEDEGLKVGGDSGTGSGEHIGEKLA